ncbi:MULTISPECIES: porin [unclassified Pseudoalteromonas]|uniref:porin n=1 Tax=unclassified Pseudoalteromonas TaxID=194690 RepID=UPI0006D664B7|nr:MULTISPECIES: porin [unclassified Pseudoalteromonas]KPZ52793.1 Major outer membrane protein P.IB precursor [Pseudoalteromonas sp. P1-25]KPZ53753.1 Major outer membrane protein P.IB precursor [Pseudoalteromonas sp. P1-13-1a]KPZ56978.1 Major outer membrane protein P.IB precursor [Pseudoalteromonas sp. P1-7a]TMO71984.1 porin [Pseudoalteromonas sp. S3785]
MNFVKSSLCIALVSGLSFSAFADVDVYGKANVTVQSSDDGEGSFTEIKSNASRFGLKGSEKITDGLEAVYKFEFQVDVSDADSKGDNDDNISARNQYVGLKGAYGQVVVGRNDTALKQSQGKLDLFNDLEGDIKNVFKGENRLGDSITYTSKSYEGFKVLATFIAEDDVDADNGYSMAVTYGDAALKKSAVYASVAADSEVNGYDVVRASIQGKVESFKLGAMYQTQEKVDGSAEADGYLLNAAYSMGKNTFKVQYQAMDFDDSDDKTAVSVGVDHKFNKNIKVFGFYSSFDMDNNVDQDYVGLGMEYKF